MSSRRKRRRAAERRLEKARRRYPLTIWAILLIALAITAVAVARVLS